MIWNAIGTATVIVMIAALLISALWLVMASV